MLTRHVVVNSRGVPHLGYVRRHLSSIASFESSLRNTLIARRGPVLHDYLSPQPSYLLRKTLQDFLPYEQFSPNTLPSADEGHALPPGHHLIYFPTPTTASELLPDGTDTLHCPGPPFTRRLWAGGHIRFLPSSTSPSGSLHLNCRRAVCLEGIRDVQVRAPNYLDGGSGGNEISHNPNTKVLVEIERRVAHTLTETESEDSIRSRLWTSDPSDPGDALIIERRDLLFLPANTSTPSSPLQSENGTPTAPLPPRRPISPPPKPPAFAYPLTPTPSLLFRYSALMFNAHAIHLDPLYTTLHESQPNILVQGPLLVTLLLESLRIHLSSSPPVHEGQGEKNGNTPTTVQIREISYKNLLPVYVNEPITICGSPKISKSKSKSKSVSSKPSTGHESEEEDGTVDDGDSGSKKRVWNVYILGPEGGMRVRGTVITEEMMASS